jgi:hypothetical protein
LSEAAKVLKERQSFNNEVLRGYVTGLKRDVQPTDGSIRLKADVEGKYRSVSIELPEDEYQKAIDAHNSKQLFQVEGDLAFEGQRYYLRNPRNVQVMEESEDP